MRLGALWAGLGFMLMACGSTAAPQWVVSRAQTYTACGAPMMLLYFVEGSDRLTFPTNHAVYNNPHIMEVCGDFELVVLGLADPSSDSLEGRRARTVAQLIQSLGWPQPKFQDGNAEDRELPAIFLVSAGDPLPTARSSSIIDDED